MIEAQTTWFFDTVEATALAPAERRSVLLFERSATRGAMAPLHRRPEDETFRVVDGEVTFFVGDEAVRARAGDVVVAPSGIPRTFRVESAVARWLVLTRVASLERYEDFGRAVAPPVLDGWWPSEDELAALEAIARANGIEILAPPGVVAVSA